MEADPPQQFDPVTPLKSAKYITQLLGSENAVLLENQAVGHTTVSQSSNCTRSIVSNFLLNSQVGQYGPSFLYAGADKRRSSVAAQTGHQVRGRFKRFLPRQRHQRSSVPLASVKEYRGQTWICTHKPKRKLDTRVQQNNSLISLTLPSLIQSRKHTPCYLNNQQYNLSFVY